MNIHLANAKPAVRPHSKAYLGFVDCDVHPMFKSPTELQEFLPKRWRGPRDRRPPLAGAICGDIELPAHQPRQRHAR
jgi:hypothetical protein